MYCNYCGKVIPDDSNLCAYCGKRVAGVIARERLVRPRQGRKIAGVCAGLAEYYDLDATLIRIVGRMRNMRRSGSFGLHRCLDHHSGRALDAGGGAAGYAG